MSTRLYLSVKELTWDKVLPPHPTVYRHVAEARNPHIGCSGLWKAVSAGLARPPLDAALQARRRQPVLGVR